jgi:hypothetical protein
MLEIAVCGTRAVQRPCQYRCAVFVIVTFFHSFIADNTVTVTVNVFSALLKKNTAPVDPLPPLPSQHLGRPGLLLCVCDCRLLPSFALSARLARADAPTQTQRLALIYSAAQQQV